MRNKLIPVINWNIQMVMAAAVFAAMTVFYQCTYETATPSLPDTVSFSAHILPLFQENCSTLNCHSGASPTGNLNLSDAVAYDQLFAKHEIDTLTPSHSLLYIQMNSSGTPMPPTGRLGDYDVNLVLKWIEQGAKRN